jgi:hypothetical protein
MPREIIRFEPGIPVEVAFQYSKGNECISQYGKTQYFRGTTDGRGIYLEPEVEAQLLKIGVRKGDQVGICKRVLKDTKGKKETRWEVELVRTSKFHEDVGSAPAQNVEAVPEKSTPPSVCAHAEEPLPASDSPEKRQPHNPISTIMQFCIMAAIDATREAQLYAAQVGLPLKFSEEQIQALASTLYIQHSKQSNISQMHQNQVLRANGGADPWRH